MISQLIHRIMRAVVRRHTGAALAAPAALWLLTSCSGGGNAITSAMIPQGEVRAPISSLGATASISYDLLYVANHGTISINVYNHDAQGNTSPKFVIAGSNTLLTSPGQLSEDAQGNLYVANGQSILVFAHGAHGNVAPIRDITGPATGIHAVQTVTVDKTTGKIFTVDFPIVGCPPVPAKLLRFPPNANGNEAPFAAGLIQSASAYELAQDSSGQNIIEAHSPSDCSFRKLGVTTYPKQFPNGSDMPVLQDISAFNVLGLANDPSTKTYVVSSFDGLYRLAETTGGFGPDSGYPTPPHFTSPAVSLITKLPCRGQLAVAPRPYPHTYMACDNSVYVYTNNANGNAIPLRVLSGKATQMNDVSGIFEGP